MDADHYIRYTQKYRKIFGTKFVLCDFFADIGITNPFLKIIRGITERTKTFKIVHKCPYKTVRVSDIVPAKLYCSNSRVRFCNTWIFQVKSMWWFPYPLETIFHKWNCTMTKMITLLKSNFTWKLCLTLNILFKIKLLLYIQYYFTKTHLNWWNAPKKLQTHCESRKKFAYQKMMQKLKISFLYLNNFKYNYFLIVHILGQIIILIYFPQLILEKSTLLFVSYRVQKWKAFVFWWFVYS